MNKVKDTELANVANDTRGCNSKLTGTEIMLVCRYTIKQLIRKLTYLKCCE